MSAVNFTISKTSATPIADQIYNAFLTQIVNGQLAHGARLPTERDLAETLGVSRGTVKRAYSRLAEANAIEIRMGSGSYVLADGSMLDASKKEATAHIAATFSRMEALGLSEQEIVQLFNLYASSRAEAHVASVMMLSDNHALLNELEQRLATFSGSPPLSFALSFFSFDQIKNSADLVASLGQYDLIIATTVDYAPLLALAPMHAARIIEVGISPRTTTLVELSELPPSTSAIIVYRNGIYRDMAIKTLTTLGFARDSIYLCDDPDFACDFDASGRQGANVLLHFGEAEVCEHPVFLRRSAEFERAGGYVLRFEHRIDHASLIRIENRVRALVD